MSITVTVVHWSKAPVLESEGFRVRFPMETNIFILNFSLASRFAQIDGAHANEIKHDHSPVVYVDLDSLGPRYD